MTEKLKCPCGKYHGRDLKGSARRISEQLNRIAQVPLRVEPRPRGAASDLMFADEFDPTRVQSWTRGEWQTTPMPLPTGYEPMRIPVPPEMARDLSLPLAVRGGTRWDNHDWGGGPDRASRIEAQRRWMAQENRAVLAAGMNIDPGNPPTLAGFQARWAMAWGQQRG